MSNDVKFAESKMISSKSLAIAFWNKNTYEKAMQNMCVLLAYLEGDDYVVWSQAYGKLIKKEV